MKRWVALALAMGLLAGCSRSGPGLLQRTIDAFRARFSDGRGELQRAYEAKKKARSWRMKTVLTGHPGSPMITLTEVSCPERVHMVFTYGTSKFEAIRVGGDAYLQGGDQGWTKTTATPESYPCGANPGQPAPWAMMNEGMDSTTALAMLAKDARITRGARLEVEGQPCQVWVVTLGHPGGGGGHTINYDVCIGSDDLTRQVAVGKGMMVVTYYDWNVPIEIVPPTELKVESNPAH